MSRTTKKDYPKKFDSRRFDWKCRHGGSCSYCRDNRTFFDKKARSPLEGQEKEWFGYWGYPDHDVFEESDRLMVRFGWNPRDPQDMRDSGMWT